MKRTHQVHVKQLQKYAMHLEAVRWNEGFRKETDNAFAKFWERDGDSLRKEQFILVDAEGNRKSFSSLGELLGEHFEEPDSDPEMLNRYCFSPEARQVQRRYALRYPYHYNQPALLWRPGQIEVVSLINADGFVGKIDGKPVWISRYPCLQAIRNQSLNRLDIEIDLTWPKQEIMKIFEMVLEDALQERESVGKKTKKRDLAVDSFPFKVWYMHKKQGKSPWKITQELNPSLKTLTAKGCTKEKCLDKIDFQELSNEKKENYNNEFCGKKDSCLIAKALLKNVRDAIAKAESQIASVSPIK